MEAIIESVDEFYSESLAQEVVRGMRKATSRGYFLASRAPFGYNRIRVSDGVKDRPTLEVDPDAAPIVKEIFESSRRGNGLAEICKELNGQGITNRARRWQKNVVHYLLTNEAYTGTAVWGVKSKDEKAGEPVRVENAWPALVSRESAGSSASSCPTARCRPGNTPSGAAAGGSRRRRAGAGTGRPPSPYR